MKGLVLSLSVAMFVLSAATMMLTVVSAHTPRIAVTRSHEATDGAFRDGLFLGRIDAEQGRQRHVSSGRWSSEADRRSFVLGYQQGYGKTQATGVTVVD